MHHLVLYTDDLDLGAVCFRHRMAQLVSVRVRVRVRLRARARARDGVGIRVWGGVGMS